MSSTRHNILQSLREVQLIDPHSHINPHQPASKTLADILGYHYYTELVHSAGMPKGRIESASLPPRELVGRLVKGLHHLSNTAQHAWLMDICSRFFGFEDDVINNSNWEALYDKAESAMQAADWADSVLEKSNVQGVFLTNDFDDKLSGFDTKKYIPCLRTDDLVFHLSKSEVRDRLAICSGIDIDGSLKSLRDAIEQRFEHFVANGARACAISLPPDFSPAPVSDGRAATALDAILRSGPSADDSHKAAIARRVFWTIVELCDEFRLPMDLMIGVNRGVYVDGVYQGRDLYDSRVSLIQYRDLFNAFPDVKFPISVLASVTNQELVSYAWIFPNVITNGHWWYSNTPSFIRRDAAARLEAVPRNKQIGYYSDAYKLEFIAPKFDMYRRILAGILFDDFCVERGWSEDKAIELGRQILRGNVDVLFPDRSALTGTTTKKEHTSFGNIASQVVVPAMGFGSAIAMERDAEMVSVDDVELVEMDELEIDPMLSSESIGERNISDSTIVDIANDVIDYPAKTISSLEDNLLIDEPELMEDVKANHETLAPAPDWEDSLDPYATIQLNNGFDDENDVETEQDYFSDSDEADESSAPADIRYFRADEMDDADLADDLLSIEEDNDAGMFADPITGELTMPTSSIDDSSSETLEETYLIPVEAIDDENTEPMLSLDDGSALQEPFDPEQTLDVDSEQDDSTNK